ncbi:MAG: HRDC domain-containing protein [Pyrinomonadaceae bacterium]
MQNDAAQLANWFFVKTPEQADRLSAWWNGADVLGLDTETFWSPGGRGGTNVSLIQLAKPNGEAVVIDALAAGVDAVRTVIGSENPIKVAHNARFDQGVLIGAGLQPNSLVDTLQLARWALIVPSYSLKALVAELFGVELNKSFQRSNWRRRPLSEAQLFYAATDAQITLRLYFELRRMLEERGRWQPALHAATLKSKPDETPVRRRRPRGTAPSPPTPLTPDEQRMVERLKEWRLQRARDLRVPAYMICPDRTLDHLARTRPPRARRSVRFTASAPRKSSASATNCWRSATHRIYKDPHLLRMPLFTCSSSLCVSLVFSL